MKKIAIVDPASYTLPYDYFYIKEISKYYKVDFYYSNTKYNYECIEKLRKNNNVSLFEYNISSSINTKMYGMMHYLKMMKDIFVDKDEYLNIHFIWSIFSLLEVPFFLVIKSKLIFTFHNDVPHDYHKNMYLPYQIINRLAKKIVFVSDFTKNKFIKNYGKNNNFYLIKHGIMPIDSINKKEKVSGFSRELIFWGRVENYKGLDIFNKYLNDYNISIYGKWNSCLNDLKALLASKENISIIDDYLVFDDLSNLLSRKSVFILPYKSATQSGVLYTLLAYEKVFISSDVGENKEFLKNNGLEKLVFNRDDEKSIINAIEYAIGFYENITEKMYAIRKKYEWENIMEEQVLRELYE